MLTCFECRKSLSNIEFYQISNFASFSHVTSFLCVDGDIFENTRVFFRRTKKMRLQKNPDTCGRGHKKSVEISGGFRGRWWQLPPFTIKIHFGAPFLARAAPLILTKIHSFSMLHSECGKTNKLRRYSEEKPENFLD